MRQLKALYTFNSVLSLAIHHFVHFPGFIRRFRPHRGKEHKKMKRSRQEMEAKVKVEDQDMSSNLSPPELPQDWKDFIEGELGGTEITRVCQKTLSPNDTKYKSRVIMLPRTSISSLDFFREDELETISIPSKKEPKSVPIRVIGPSRKKYSQTFRTYHKKSGNKVTRQYSLTGVADEFLGENDLKVGNEVQFWSFRAMENQREELHMAIVVVGRSLGPKAGRPQADEATA